MTPGLALLVKCPYCGTKKELMTLASGNTFGADYWSDNKRVAPMLPSASPVQKCPHCGKYYLKSKQQSERGDDYSFETGDLSYLEWKEAFSQFVSQSGQKDLNRHTLITDDDMVNIRFWLIHAYNDYFHRERRAEPSQEEYAFFCGVVNDFIDTFDWSSVSNPLLKAEFYREANEMEKCAEVLESISYDQLQDFEKGIFEGIKMRMEKKDVAVYKLFV